ncbi:hypothetical protein AAFN85_09540 [Mucilaginibacter sp. CAU 1740]|uniref:hypothetical protein n=1 Tax=Mucilaginibacter sp. CAU 1740 TaxID=3140365 RepID=UPI00325BDF6E
MKELNDEDIQRLLEQGETADDSRDSDLYKIIFRELKVKPSIPAVDLGTEVIAVIQRKKDRLSAIKTLVAYCVMGLAGIVFTLIALLIFGNNLFDGIMPLNQILNSGLFILAMTLFALFADRYVLSIHNHLFNKRDQLA